MRKKKALIVIDNLNTGGVASSLYNFLYFAENYLSIDLLAFDVNSIDETKIPNSVSIIQSPKVLTILGKNSADLRGSILFVEKAFFTIIARLIGGEFARKILFGRIQNIGDYDFAISYAQDNAWKSLSKGCNDFVVKKVDAKKKMCFIHCDYRNYGGYDARQEKILSQMDSIVCVSESCRKSFSEMFPHLSEKSIVCENFINIDYIEASIRETIEYPKNKINFISVCRLSTVKGLDRTIKAFANLKNEGFNNFSWTIVGDGPEKNNLEKTVNDNNLSDSIAFVGQKDNPFPYYKSATAFLLPSLHEAAPMVFGESAAVGLPILSTETCSAIELVKKRNIGIVVENSQMGIENGIRDILTGKTFLNNYKTSRDNININAMNQLKAIISRL